MRNVIAVLALASFCANAFATKTDEEVIAMAAESVQKAVIQSTTLITNVCNGSVEFNEEAFAQFFKKSGFDGVISSYAGSGTPEGSGSYREHLSGAIVVGAGEAYMTPEEFRESKKLDGPTSMVLGVKLVLDRHSCKKNDIQGTLQLYRDKNNNIVSTTEFKIK